MSKKPRKPTYEALQRRMKMRAEEIVRLREESAKLLKKDAWHDQIVKWMAATRWSEFSTEECLGEAIGLARADTESGRRVSLIMARIGGWKASTNVPIGEGRRVRGYKKL